MQAGRIVDVGTVADVRARQPLFAQMLRGADAATQDASADGGTPHVRAGGPMALEGAAA